MKTLKTALILLIGFLLPIKIFPQSTQTLYNLALGSGYIVVKHNGVANCSSEQLNNGIINVNATDLYYCNSYNTYDFIVDLGKVYILNNTKSVSVFYFYPPTPNISTISCYGSTDGTTYTALQYLTNAEAPLSLSASPVNARYVKVSVTLTSVGSPIISEIKVYAIGANFNNISATNLQVSGKIGIGTTAPGFPLHVVGKTYITGNVGIGTGPSSYTLDVHGTIRAEDITVSLFTPADYVFKKGYYLRPLNDVEAYIKENSHLPDVKSAEQITNEGLNLSEMNNILLQKVEELTLYIIEQNKRIEALEKANKKESVKK